MNILQSFPKGETQCSLMNTESDSVQILNHDVVIFCTTSNSVISVNNLIDRLNVQGCTSEEILDHINSDCPGAYAIDRNIQLLSNSDSLIDSVELMMVGDELSDRDTIEDGIIVAPQGEVSGEIEISFNSNRMEPIVQSNTVCSICLESTENSESSDSRVCVTKCGHTFHRNCICRYFEIGKCTRCPNCRSSNINEDLVLI